MSCPVVLGALLRKARAGAGWEQMLGAGAAAHVEGWPSRLGSLSLAMLGGTGAFLRSLRFGAGRLEPSASGVVLLVFLKEQLVFWFF